MSCIHGQYFTNNINVGVQLNLVEVTGTNVLGYGFRLYRPALIVGVAYYPVGGAVPNGGVGSVAPIYGDIVTAQAAFPYSLLAQSLMSANIDATRANGGVGTNQSGFLTYTENDTQVGSSYGAYLKRYLNDSLTEVNFFTFLTAHLQIENFWNTLVAPDYYNISELAKVLKDTTDLRMWLPPGLYEMEGNATNTDPYFANAATVLELMRDAGNAVPLLITAELKSIE
jgi:hypothetical protein